MQRKRESCMSTSPIMGGEGSLLDASSYMLVEAIGDSESEYYDASAAELAGSAAEDDAESCSCGFLSDFAAARQIDGGAGGDDFLDTGFDDCVEEEGGGCGTAEVEDGVVDQCRGGAAAELNKSKGCEESNMKLMSEKEMDRLFWEACLAS